VVGKFLVFRRDDGNMHGRGNLCPACPVIANGGALSGNQVGETSPKHEGTRRRRHPSESEHGRDGEADGPQQG
jgi:hypothetical protein